MGKKLSLCFQAQQTDDTTKYRMAEIQFEVAASNQNNPVISSNTGSFNAYVYEAQAPGVTVRASQTGTSPAAFEIIVSDPDVVNTPICPI